MKTALTLKKAIRASIVLMVLASCLVFSSFLFSHPSSVSRNDANQRWLNPIAGAFVYCAFNARDCSQFSKNPGVVYGNSQTAAVISPSSGLVIASAESDFMFPQHRDLIVIEHSDSTVSIFSNVGKRLVKTGQTVQRGQRIAMTKKPHAKGKLVKTQIVVIEKGVEIDPFIRLPYVFFDLVLPAPK